MKIAIIGKGVYGTFLHRELSGSGLICSDSHPGIDTAILAVPFDKYEEVAKQYAGLHLVNVCSIQEDSTDICRMYSDEVTSIHTTFGPNSSLTNRTMITTYCGLHSKNIRELFVGRFRSDEIFMSPSEHDKLMAQAHLPTMNLLSSIRALVESTKDIPIELCPGSLRKLREFVSSSADVSEGTLRSIRSNKYG